MAQCSSKYAIVRSRGGEKSITLHTNGATTDTHIAIVVALFSVINAINKQDKHLNVNVNVAYHIHIKHPLTKSQKRRER